MDVQTENVDPPPSESQSGGKIRKGFKLFGKRKPGNIFSIRSKGDGNNKSPVNRSKTLDGLSETAAPDSEQDPEKEKGQDASQGEREQAEEEPLGEDGVLAAAIARTSISSTSSAKSLSFLTLLRGGRRGNGDRRVHTVSQPVGRQRRGLKGLFGNVKFRSKDKEDKEEAPPSPLLMSSRANSVEIIKEDLTLTPKAHPRSLDSPGTESGEPTKDSTTQDSAATTPSETVTPQVAAGNVSRTNEHVPPLPASEPPMMPGDNSLSSLLADISSLLTFDSISGGGDIMADVEAEWGKASSAISAAVSEATPSSTSLFSKPATSSPLTSFGTTATAKYSSVAVPATATTKSFTPQTASSSSPVAKPSTIITTLTKTSTLTTQSVKWSSDSAPASTPTPPVWKPSTTPVTTTIPSAPKTSSPSTFKPTSGSTSTTATAPLSTAAAVAKAPSVTPTLTSTVSKSYSEPAAPPKIIPSASKPVAVATPPPVAAKSPPVTPSPPTPVVFTPPAKPDPASYVNLKTSTSYKPPLTSSTEESKVPVTAPPACTVTTKPAAPVPAMPSKMTTFPTSTKSSVPEALSKPALTSSPMDVNQTPPSFPHLSSSSTPGATTKTQPSPASAPPPPSASLDKIPPIAKTTPAPFSLDKMPPAPTPAPAPTTHVVVTTASPTPPAPGQITVSQPKPPPAHAQIPVSISKDPPAPAQTQVSQPKPSPVPVQSTISAPKDPPAPAQIGVSQPKPPPAPAQIPISVSKDPPAPAQIQVSQPKPSLAPAQIPVSVSKDPPCPAKIPVSVSSDIPVPVRVPVSVSKEPPAPAQIPVSQPKAPPVPTSPPFPVTSPSSLPAPWPSEAPASAKTRGSGQASVDGPLMSPSSTGPQTVSPKTDEQHSESRTSLQGPPREKKTQAKASGLSKIPIVGGGRAGKIPVRDSQHVEDEVSRDPPTPVLEEERPHFNSHDAGSKDKISDVGAVVPTSKHSQEESQQPAQPKALTSLPRDSKIPVKHGAQSQTASQIPQAKEPPRTKIPVSKVPVRRAVNKPAAAGGSSTQVRK